MRLKRVERCKKTKKITIVRNDLIGNGLIRCECECGYFEDFLILTLAEHRYCPKCGGLICLKYPYWGDEKWIQKEMERKKKVSRS